MLIVWPHQGLLLNLGVHYASEKDSVEQTVLYMMMYVVFASAAMTKTKEQVELGCSVPVHDGYIKTVFFRTVLQSCAQYVNVA